MDSKFTAPPMITGSIAVAILLLLLISPTSYSQNEASLADAWLEGRLDTILLLDPNLNELNLDSDVIDGRATITGTVFNQFEKEFSADLARGIEGIESVENLIVVDPKLDSPASELVAELEDRAITAAISTKYLISSAIGSSSIEVETVENYVQLKGTVKSDTERALAEEIARNTYGVERLQNFLQVVQ